MDLGPDGHDVQFGAGLVNAYAALAGATLDRALFAIKDSSGTWITDSVYGTRDRTFTIPDVPIGDYVLVGFIDVDGLSLIHICPCKPDLADEVDGIGEGQGFCDCLHPMWHDRYRVGYAAEDHESVSYTHLVLVG